MCVARATHTNTHTHAQTNTYTHARTHTRGRVGRRIASRSARGGLACIHTHAQAQACLLTRARAHTHIHTHTGVPARTLTRALTPPSTQTRRGGEGILPGAEQTDDQHVHVNVHTHANKQRKKHKDMQGGKAYRQALSEACRPGSGLHTFIHR